MKVSLQQLTDSLRTFLKKSEASAEDVEIMLELILDKELTGNRFAGLDELDNCLNQLKDSKDKKWKYLVDLPALKLVDGQGRAAPLIAMELLDTLCRMAKSQGIALIGISNSTYHGALGLYARKIAQQDLLAIISANGGPQGVVPHGGKKDIFGTNPIAYGVPTEAAPIVFDAATAKYAYGTIRQAKKDPRLKLESNSYLDAQGSYTTNPNEAVALVPFGEYKGYAINMLLEIMTGALVRGKSGLSQTKENELGSFLMALDPSKFTDLKQFKAEVSKLAEETRQVPAIEPTQPVRVPGDRAHQQRKTITNLGYLEISDESARALGVKG